jgi:glucosamine-6-phosphate deaminase
MEIIIHPDRAESGRAAAKYGAELLRTAIEEQGRASIIVATGASQFEMLAALVAEEGIDWPRVTGFHLDEYIGIPDSHPASFRNYLRERFVERVPLGQFHYVNAETDPEAECRRLGELIRSYSIDVAFVGIGENGHLAFNDPPADFQATDPYLIVELDDACRRQQLGEGWFPTFDAVPRRAISMSVRQILRSRSIVCTVPDTRKAEAVRNTVQGPVTASVPASILQQHPRTTLFLDQAAASLLAES